MAFHCKNYADRQTPIALGRRYAFRSTTTSFDGSPLHHQSHFELSESLPVLPVLSFGSSNVSLDTTTHLLKTQVTWIVDSTGMCL